MKVLLVDDHPLILSALQTMIHRLDPAVTVLSAENAVDGFELLARQPDVGLVLLDLDLGDEVDGFTVLAEMRHRHPSLPVVVLSAAERLADNPHFVFADAQRKGYGLLDFSPSELRTTLRVVDDVTRPDAGIETLARFVVQAGRPVVTIV